MKPDWNYAPDWATGGGDYDMAEATVEPSWRDSLERRP